jgi:hypothetical protein
MKRFSWLVIIAAVALGPSTAQAQSGRYARFEIVPLADYVWGGTYNLDIGDLKIDDSFGYGVMLNFLAARGTALELTYLRQDTQLRLDPNGTAPAGPRSADFATNYIHPAAARNSDKIRRSGRSSMGRSGSPCST